MSRPSLALAAAAIAGSYLAVRSGVSDPLDAAANRQLTTRRSPGRDRLVGVATDLGSVYGLAGVAGALALSGRRRTACELGAAGVAAWVAAQGAKPLLRRPRPYELGSATRLVAIPAGSSWPSGHAAVAAAMAASLPTGSPAASRVWLTAITAGVGISRLQVGVHHLTDVVAGVGVGVLSAAATRRAGQWLIQRRAQGG